MRSVKAWADMDSKGQPCFRIGCGHYAITDSAHPRAQPVIISDPVELTEEEILAIKLFLAGGGVSIIAFQPIILKLCLYAGVRI